MKSRKISEDTGAREDFINDASIPPADASEPVVAGEAARLPRVLGIALAAIFLALPVVYLAVHSSGHRQIVHAQQSMQTVKPTDTPSLEELARAQPSIANRLNLALAYINANHPDQAAPILASVVASDKANATAWNDLCVANTLLKNYVTAIPQCEHAVALDPSFQLARNNLKWAQDENAKASPFKAPPTVFGAGFYIAQGLNQLHADNYDAAIASWQEALKRDPRSAVAANNIGTAYMLKKQTGAAIGWFEKSIQLDPSLQLAKNNLAWAHDEQAKETK